MEKQLSNEDVHQLTGGGDCNLHSHSADRLVTSETINQYEAQKKVRFISADDDALYTDNIIVADTTAGDITISLPAAKGGKEFIFVKAAAGNDLVAECSGTDTIFGSTSTTVVTLGASIRLKAITGGWITL